jgi:hypothetical protein
MNENPGQGVNAYVNILLPVTTTPVKSHRGLVYTGEQLSTGVVDTADKHKAANIRKSSKWPNRILLGQEKLILEKNLKMKILCQTSFQLVIHIHSLGPLGLT